MGKAIGIVMDNNERMEITCFKEVLLGILNKKSGDDCKFVTGRVNKNNKVVLEGIYLENPPGCVSPTFYVEDLYCEYCRGYDVEGIADRVLHSYQNIDVSLKDRISFYTDYECVKEKVSYMLVNYDENEDMLQDMPHRKFLDLAIIYYCKVEASPVICGNIKVRNEHLKLWGVTEAELYERAEVNTQKLLPVYVADMKKALKDIVSSASCEGIEEVADIHENAVSEAPGLYVMTNGDGYYGAAAILYNSALKNFAGKMNKDLYIIPSSIHEVLLLPADCRDDEFVKSMQDMVFEVNTMHVTKEERLSYNIYYYSKDDDSIIVL